MPKQLAALFFLCIGLMPAQCSLVQNASFETATLPLSSVNGQFNQLISGSTIPGYSLSGTVANWTASSTTKNAGAGIATHTPGGNNWTTKWWTGNNIAWLQETSAGTASLAQTLPDVLRTNTTYTLSAQIGRRALAVFNGAAVRFDYSIQLWAGSTLLASSTNKLALAYNSAGMDSLTYSSGATNAQAGQSIMIVLTSSGTNGATTETFFDDISLTAATGAAVTTVVSASGFGGFSAIAPGTWIEIYGANLSATTRSWGGADFKGINAPTLLDGTSVSIGGQAAFVAYISPSQVNALVPSTVGGGFQQVTVTTPTSISGPFSILVNAAQPGLLAPPSFSINGRQYVVAQFADGTYVLPRGAIAGLNSRPARPGETIIIYGIGFGPVTPGFVAGQLVEQSNTLASSFQMFIGNVPVMASYDGLAPNFTGLYQFNIVIPNVLPADAVPLTFTLNGIQGAQVLTIAVGN